MTATSRNATKIFFTLFTASFAAPHVAHAQEMNLSTLADDDKTDRVFIRTGAEYGLVTGLGYAKALRILDRPTLASAEVSAPWSGLNGSDFRVRLGLLAPVVNFGRWQIAASLAPTLRRTGNDLAEMTSVGADLGLTGGYYARHWFLAGEAGFDWAMSTHVDHSRGYRDNVYASARDGWYANPGANVRYGLQTGASFSRYDIVLRAGQVRDVAGDAPLLPFYGTLALVTRW